ncbi:IS3 family transposase [Kitasatospora sp. NPDC058063]|uniref:IS3 family transposase n=1 Tax=unclassified Kitasatospora TaxID=2633591 RepID=UPI0036DF014A
MVQILRVYEQSEGTFGARRVWDQLRGQGIDIARCTVERLMRQAGLAGASGAPGLRAEADGPDRPDRPAYAHDRMAARVADRIQFANSETRGVR